MIPEIDPAGLAARLAAGDAVLVDVREAPEHSAGHVPGARNIPLSELPGRLAELPEDRPVLVICESGGRSLRATALMRAVGIDAHNVTGGTGAWRRSGRSIRTAA